MVDGKDEYSAKGLYWARWPPPEATADGRWNRVWKVRFVAKAKDPQLLEQPIRDLKLTAFDVHVQPIGDHELIVNMTTATQGVSGEAYVEIFRLLKTIEDVIGTISTIAGIDRDLWLPWSLDGKT